MKRLTFEDHFSLGPAISPDGKQIAYSTYDNIYALYSDGSAITKLTSDDGPYIVSSFSPDRSMLVCLDGSCYPHDDEAYDLVLVDINSGAKQRLTDTGDASTPAFSPDGEDIIFESNGGGVSDLYMISYNAPRIIRLTQTPHVEGEFRNNNREPVFAPDGQWVYYLSSAHHPLFDQNHEVYRMRPDGAEQQRLSQTDGKVTGFCISPDSARITYSTWIERRSPKRPQTDIWLMNADGTDARLLEEGTSVSWLGGLSPDGKWLVVSSSRDHVARPGRGLCWAIYIINTTTGEILQLTDAEARDRDPLFSPDGTQIIFESDRDGKGDLYAISDLPI